MEEEKFYHIFNRGNNRENIFKEEENYHYFLKQYEKYLSGAVDTYAYCLMPNHFHFLVRIKEQAKLESATTMEILRRLTPAEKAFKDFFISYAKSINKKYNRTGSLFQYKFKRKPVESQNYLRKLVLYIHQNPIEAGFCDQIDEWKFSSFNSLINNSPSILKTGEVIDWFENVENFKYCHKTLQALEI